MGSSFAFRAQLRCHQGWGSLLVFFSSEPQVSGDLRPADVTEMMHEHHPHVSVPRLFPWQNNPTGSPRSPRASVLLSSLPLWAGQGMKPQTPTPPPHSRGFIEGDLLMKTRPQSLSVRSSLPETGISFTALSPFQSCHCKIHPAVLDAAPWRGWEQPFGVPAGSGVFQSDGCPLQTEPQCRGPKANSSSSP